MPRARTGINRAHYKRSTERIAAYLAEHYPNVRDAAVALKINHTTLWRAARGYAARGISADTAVKLANATGKPVDYWLGRDE